MGKSKRNERGGEMSDIKRPSTEELLRNSHPRRETIKYRPSCGTEGMNFMEVFCCKCAKDDGQGYGCNIAGRTFKYEINDPQYPSEWIYDENKKPTCTAFIRDFTQAGLQPQSELSVCGECE